MAQLGYTMALQEPLLPRTKAFGQMSMGSAAVFLSRINSKSKFK